MAPQARPIDGAAGYRLFLDHDGDIELDEINEHLRGLGLREVKPRMLTHYRKLQRYGYESYLTQNRLDLAVAGEAAWSDDMRARYAEVRQSVDGELLHSGIWHAAQVSSIGASSATVTTDPVPSAGDPVVLRLTRTGIERTATVSRRDPGAGRADLVFDTLSSLPIASGDSPVRLGLTYDMAPQAESLAALSEVVIRLDRLIARVASDEDLPRVVELSKSSPLEILLVGGAGLGVVGRFMKSAVETRLTWHEGTKARLEAEGLELDSLQKQRAIEREADAQLISAIEAEEDAADTPVIDALRVDGLDKGDPGSMTRRQFIEAARAAIALPVRLVANLAEAETDPPDAGS